MGKVEFLYPMYSLRGSGPMVLDKAFLTFYDLDVSDAGPEYVALPRAYKTILSPNTTIEKVTYIDTAKYTATKNATGLDIDDDENPHDPVGLSQRQKDNCVTVLVENTSVITFAARSTKHFSFISPFDCEDANAEDANADSKKRQTRPRRKTTAPNSTTPNSTTPNSTA